MKKIFPGLLVSLSALLLLQSCSKDDPGPNPMDSVFNISFSRNALEYINIPVGKYFVYKTGSFGAPDSVVVTSSLLDVVNIPKNENAGVPEHNIERFRITMTKYFPIAGGGHIVTEWLRGSTTPQIFTPIDSSSNAPINLKFIGTDQTVFYATDNVSGGLTMMVEGVTYNNVIKAESDNGLPATDPAHQKNIFYWARGIGIIKRETTYANGVVTNWDLLRHN